MKRLLLAVLLVAVWSVDGYSQIPGTTGWYEIPSTHLRSVCPANNFMGSGYDFNDNCSGVANAWNSAVYDSTRDRLVIFGGGHNDYLGNEIYTLDMNTLVLARLNDPTIPVASGCEGDSLASGTVPNSRHTYDGISYLPTQDKMFVFGGSVSQCGGSTNGTWLFNFATNLWEVTSPSGTKPSADFGIISAYDSTSGKVFVHDNSDLFSYTPSTNTFAKLTSNVSGIDYRLSGAIDPTRHIFLLIGNGYLWTYDISSGSPTKTALTTTGGSAIIATLYPGIVYNPVRDKFAAWDGGDRVYELDLDTNIWTSTDYTGGPSAGPVSVLGHWNYSPLLDVYLSFNNVDLNIQSLRVGPVLPVGSLTEDGPPTPEQIALVLPVTGMVDQSAVATMRYRASGALSWTTGHNLYRVQPGSSLTPPAPVSAVDDVFAWPLIGLTPGTTYNVEVTVTDGAMEYVKSADFTTRTLPPAAGAHNKTITAGSSSSTIQTAFNSLAAGDVIEFQDGTYTVDTLYLDNSGTEGNPIYIRGASIDGVILSDTAGTVLQLRGANDVVIEHLTIRGSQVDSGVAASSVGVRFYDGSPMQERVTIRNTVITGVDKGIRADAPISAFLGYNNTLVGNDQWGQDFYAPDGTGPPGAGDGILDLDQNIFWNDDGINIVGFGNCAFNNTLSGFGDSFAVTVFDGDYAYGIHIYRNDILMSGDDLFEADYAVRNISFYDNRSINSMTALSLDPLYGGPLLFTRNIAVNIGRGPFKWNSENSGQFVYNNTIVRTTGKSWMDGATTAEAGWYQPNNGAQTFYGYQNNILVYRGLGSQTIRLDNSGNDPVDFSYNSWYPDLTFQWTGTAYTNLADALSSLSATDPVFGTATQRHDNDNITISNPWTVTVTLGSNYRTLLTTSYTPALTNGTTPKNSGTVIVGVTDGYSGMAPDRGAVIEGRDAVIYGNINSSAVGDGTRMRLRH